MDSAATQGWFRLTGRDRCFPSLVADRDADVVVVGGGFTGLYTALYLKRTRPDLRVVLIEARCVGYGASGRNGGWLSHLVPGNREVYARGRLGHEGVVRLQRALVDAVDDVVALADELGIDMDAHRGGNLEIATNRAGDERLRHHLAGDHAFGLTDADVQYLSASESRARINARGTVGGLFYPCVTRINPAKLVAGLAAAATSLGVEVYEQTPAVEVTPGRVRTPLATVSAGQVLVCTEAYGGPLVGAGRLAPVNSSVLLTGVLPPQAWDVIGWQGNECFSDAAHTFIYAQRTADDRILVGGRGIPYHFGSRIITDGRLPRRTVADLLGRLRTYFPEVAVEMADGWSGVIGVTRDWCASVEFDATTGIGAAYGYAGHGVTAANLFARSLVDLALGVESPLTDLPMVGHRSPSWEPEPIRWLGIRSMYELFRVADRYEERTAATRTSLLARAGGRLAGLEM